MGVLQGVGGLPPTGPTTPGRPVLWRGPAAPPREQPSCRPVSAASSHAAPSATRPRETQRGWSDVASSKASATFAVFATPDERGSQIVDVEIGLFDEVLLRASASARRVALPSRCSGRGDGARVSSASPDSPSFSSAYCRTVSSSRYRVLPPAFSAMTSDLSTSRLSWSRTWWRSMSVAPATDWAASRSNPPMNTDNPAK